MITNILLALLCDVMACSSCERRYCSLTH